MADVQIRPGRDGDAAEMATLFFETVHAVNRRDYTPEQLRAWAPEVWAPSCWIGRQKGKAVTAAVDGERIVGFAELEPDGHIDCFYVHKDRQGQGIGTLLLEEIERQAREEEIAVLRLEASITAKPFFEHRGFRGVREQQVVRRGVSLTNYLMEKPLPVSGSGTPP